MKLTIIVPVYNSERYLNSCLESISLQTFKDFEVLLIDDGSSDCSAVICQRFIDKDKRFKYFYKTNGGVSDARNYGLERASGEWVGFVDSDDSIDLNMYLWMFEKEESNCDIICCLTQRVEEGGNPFIVSKNKEFTLYSTSEAMSDYLNGKITMDVYTKVFRKRLFLSNDIRFPIGHHMEEACIMPSLFSLSNQICLLKMPLYHYFEHSNSITTRPLSEDVYNIYWVIERYRIEFPVLYPSLMKEVERFAFKECVLIYRTAILQKKAISKSVYARVKKEFHMVFWKGLFRLSFPFYYKLMGLETVTRLFLIRKH